MIVGYRVSQVVGALARLGVVDTLVDGPASDQEIASRLRLDAGQLYRLLRTAATLGLLDETAPRTFAINQMGELLRADCPGSLRTMAIAFTAPAWWLPWARLSEAIADGGEGQARAALGAGFWDYLDQHPEQAEHVRETWTRRLDWLTTGLPSLLELPERALVVDVGGGDGRLLAGILDAGADRRGLLLERPGLAEHARHLLEDLGVGERCRVVAGDFLTSVPAGGDAYVLKEVLHNWPDAQARRILENCRRAMAPGARVLLVDQLLPADGARSFTHLADLNMLVMLGGRERTVAECHRLLAQAGLRCESVTPIPGDQRGWALLSAVSDQPD
jgi:SAM-dependent methyltransferase